METIYNSALNSNNSKSEINFHIDISDEERVSNLILKAEEISKEVCSYSESNYDLRNKRIDEVLTSKKFGIPIMILFLALIFWITIARRKLPFFFTIKFF